MKSIGVTLIGLSLLWGQARVYAQEVEFERDLEQQLIKLINEEREKRGLARLEANELLQESARRHTERLADTGMLSHQFKGEPKLADRIAATGLNFHASAENVGLATDWPDIHPGFMRSEGHRANILSPKYNAVGIGVVKRDGYYYATQNFAAAGEGLTVAQAEQRVTRLLSRERGGKLKVAPNQSLRTAACAMAKRDHVDASEVPVAAGAHGALAFTASALDELPKGLAKIANNSEIRSIDIGACFLATKTYPGGTYWFAVQY
jgi:hypothetical protein